MLPSHSSGSPSKRKVRADASASEGKPRSKTSPWESAALAGSAITQTRRKRSPVVAAQAGVLVAQLGEECVDPVLATRAIMMSVAVLSLVMIIWVTRSR